MASYKQLDVYDKALNLVEAIYRCTKSFPRDEQFGLTLQLRRAVVSIVSNIAEGSQRQTKKEFVQFLYIAYGSCAEVEAQLSIAARLGYIETSTFTKLNASVIDTSKMLRSLIRYNEQLR